MVYKHAVVAGFRIYAQRGEVAAKGRLESAHYIVMEITLLIMEKSWNCVFEFLWEPWLQYSLAVSVRMEILNVDNIFYNTLKHSFVAGIFILRFWRYK